jgi:magnesium chelatase subunit I
VPERPKSPLLGSLATMTSALSGSPPAATTLGELRALGYRPLGVREEIRRNTLARLAANVPLVEGVLGFERSVGPQLERALIAGHDIILLGERGQAKSRIVRSLVNLLDEWLPVVAGSEINDDPFAPVSRYAKDLIERHGDDTLIAWVHRDDRYGEKLATPDTSIADLIGEVDPIKVAEGRYLADELTIHYGLVPRTNRGIFAINELPDLAERIQVGLLNVLEERDVQIRGYRVRLPLDVLLVATANPEDYTSRGRIITPLKDRFGAQIRTHYPSDVATEVAIVRREATPVASEGVSLVVPRFIDEIIVRTSQAARQSGKVNQRSGVSVRLSIANRETLVAAALRRAARLGEADAAPRVSDLEALYASTLGKIEVEALEEGEDEELLGELLDRAVQQTFRELCPNEHLPEIVAAFADGAIAEVGPDVPSARYEELLSAIPRLSSVVEALLGEERTPASSASAVELVLEGLHLSRRLNKDVLDEGATYRAR